MGQTLETLTVRVEKLEHDTTELFEKSNSIAVTQAAVNEKLNSVLVTLGELKEGLSRLQMMPSKRWETLISSILTATAAAIIGFIFAKLK